MGIIGYSYYVRCCFVLLRGLLSMQAILIFKLLPCAGVQVWASAPAWHAAKPSVNCEPDAHDVIMPKVVASSLGQQAFKVRQRP
jgi:hypothetical protein